MKQAAAPTEPRTASARSQSSETPLRLLESRADSRTNLFVSAALHSGDECFPAKVRNLSKVGALVEAPLLPATGGAVRLCRGSLSVTGRVVWRRGGKAGLKFDSAVNVEAWLPRRVREEQAKIDEFLHQARMGSVPKAGAAAARGGTDKSSSCEELNAAALLVEKVAESLSCDPHLLTHHGWKLQQLEVAIQKIRRISKEQANEH